MCDKEFSKSIIVCNIPKKMGFKAIIKQGRGGCNSG
jgi:hypothetical protein